MMAQPVACRPNHQRSHARRGSGSAGVATGLAPQLASVVILLKTGGVLPRAHSFPLRRLAPRRRTWTIGNRAFKDQRDWPPPVEPPPRTNPRPTNNATRSGIRGRGIRRFRWTNIDTRYPRPYTPRAAMVAVDSVRIAAGVVTGGEGGRTTGERDTCKDRAQKNPTANHACLSFLP